MGRSIGLTLQRLRERQIAYGLNWRLVRGLDYYTRTLFEITASSAELGTQNALCGGGRYDKMIEGLGGPTTPAVGLNTVNVNVKKKEVMV